MEYGYKRKVECSFDEAVVRVKEELAKEGFGILTTIDVEAKFKEKLGIDFGKYIILGACNPKLAHEVLKVERDIGLLLPCNVIVYVEEGEVFVSIINPLRAMSIVGNKSLEKFAQDVDDKLKKVYNNL